MSLIVKLLDAPAFFLLTFEPIPRSPADADLPPLKPFRVLIDPVLNQASRSHPDQACPCISSLWDIPEIDLVIITSPAGCHRPTLRQLPAGTSALRMSPLVIADRTSAKLIRRWNHFDPERVRHVQPWRDGARGAVARAPVPAFLPGGLTGEITVALVPPARGDAHAVRRGGAPAAVGITYRPPPTTAAPTPGGRSSGAALSVVFSPRGTGYASIKPFVTGHLVAEAALPLTCLLHPFEGVVVPWWYFGKEAGRAGGDAGCETATALGARGWVWGKRPGGREDAGKRLTSLIRVKLWTVDELLEMLSMGPDGKGAGGSTAVEELGVGDDMILTNT